MEGDAPEMVRALGGLVHLLPRSATRDTVRHCRTDGKEGEETDHTSEAQFGGILCLASFDLSSKSFMIEVLSSSVCQGSLVKKVLYYHGGKNSFE